MDELLPGLVDASLRAWCEAGIVTGKRKLLDTDSAHRAVELALLMEGVENG